MTTAPGLRAMLLGLSVLATAPMAAACDGRANVSFRDAAPADILVIDNESAAGWRIASLWLDLGPTPAQLYVDLPGGPAGVGSAAPLRLLTPDATPEAARPETEDGATFTRFAFDAFPAGAQARYSLDLDDRALRGPAGRTRVQGSEIFGAAAGATFIGPTGRPANAEGVFGPDGRVQIQTLCAAS